MPRVKERYFSVEMQEEDSLHEYHNNFLNFIVKEKDLEYGFISCDLHNIIKEKSNEKDLKEILKNPINSQYSRQLKHIGDDVFFINEISLSKPLKTSEGYLYQIYDYNENKALFCGFNDVLTYIKRKIKTKYALAQYNGENQRFEFSEKDVANIMTRMTPGTHSIFISQLSTRGDEGEPIAIIPYKIIDTKKTQ